MDLKPPMLHLCQRHAQALQFGNPLTQEPISEKLVLVLWTQNDKKGRKKSRD